MNKYRNLLSLSIIFAITSLAMAGESRGRLGVYLGTLDDGIRDEFSFQGEGVLISGVVPDSGADEAGLQKGDIILAIDGKDVKDSKDIITLLESTGPGENVTVAYFRDGDTHDAVVLLGEDSIFKVHRLPAKNKWVFASGSAHGYIGIEMKDLNDQLAEYFDVKGGILIDRVVEESPAAEAGLKAGDVITSFDGQAVKGTKDLYKILSDLEEGKKVPLDIVRKGKDKNVEVTLGPPKDHSGKAFQFFSDDEDTIIVRPHEMKDFKWKAQAFEDIHIPEIEIHELIRDFDNMEEFRAEMEKLKEELKRVKEELKELKTPE